MSLCVSSSTKKYFKICFSSDILKGAAFYIFSVITVLKDVAELNSKSVDNEMASERLMDFFVCI